MEQHKTQAATDTRSSDRLRTLTMASLEKADPTYAALARYARSTGGGVTSFTQRQADGTVAGGRHRGQGLFAPDGWGTWPEGQR